MTRDLVIARVGRNSLHRCWLDRGAPRNWDLYLCPFQDIPPQDETECTTGRTIAGPKWTGLRTLLREWDGWRDYDHIWLPDDDIFASQSTISAMFAAARALRLRLCAPSLHERSHYAHFNTMRNPRFFARRVGFVEIMVPCFERATLDDLLPTFDLSTTGWGWGLDALWPKLLDYAGLGVLDGVPVLHTRPVGGFRDPELSRQVFEEADRMQRQHHCEQRMATFAGIGHDHGDLALTPEQLLVELVRGWQYLFDQHPAALYWITAHQQPDARWQDYPIGGTPTSPHH